MGAKKINRELRELIDDLFYYDPEGGAEENAILASEHIRELKAEVEILKEAIRAAIGHLDNGLETVAKEQLLVMVDKEAAEAWIGPLSGVEGVSDGGR